VLVSFIETAVFSQGWKDLGLTVDDLLALQEELMAQPKGFPIVRQTGGLRKARFGPKGRGKRGAFRVGHAYFESYQIILLVVVFAKNEKADLSPADKKAIRVLLAQVEKEFSQRTR
jgi:hypothetical protein